MKTIIFKTNAGEHIGFGHLRRCMTLAKQLVKMNCRVLFLINNSESAAEILACESFAYDFVTDLDNESFVDTQQIIEQLDADVLVIDSYNIAFKGLGIVSIPIVYLDDLGVKDGVFDLIINPSMNETIEEPNDARLLYGPKYALLREEFSCQNPKNITDTVQKVLITLGGSDPRNYTLKLLQWLCSELPELEATVVLGPFFTEKVKKGISNYAANKQKITVRDSPENLQLLMLEADAVVSAGGQTTYELAAQGCPSIIVSVAENQTSNIEMLQQNGAIYFIGSMEQENIESIYKSSLVNITADKNLRQTMSKAGMQLVDGFGAEKVALAVCNLKCRETRGA